MNERKPLDGGETLWRRIHPDHVLHNGIVSSAAFSNLNLSVDVARIQKHMSTTLGGGAGVAEFKATAAQELNQQTVADPLPENPAHALVIGNKSPSVKRALRDAATFTPRERIRQEPQTS